MCVSDCCQRTAVKSNLVSSWWLSACMFQAAVKTVTTGHKCCWNVSVCVIQTTIETVTTYHTQVLLSISACVCFRLLSKYTKEVQAKVGQGLSAFIGAFNTVLLWKHMMAALEGRLWLSDIFPCLESQGCHLIPLSYLMFFCLVLLFCHFSDHGPFS